MQTVGEGRIRMFMNSIFRAGMANWVDDTLIKGKNFFYPVDIIYFRVTENLFTTRVYSHLLVARSYRTY